MENLKSPFFLSSEHHASPGGKTFSLTMVSACTNIMDGAKELHSLGGNLRKSGFGLFNPGEHLPTAQRNYTHRNSKATQFQIFCLADPIRMHKQETSFGVSTAR